jgi:TetR/AcrR family transcriptional regulator
MNAIRRHDPEASRSAILDAAEQLFLEHGFAGTSMSEIAKASGVTKSLIHHHFGSKDALWSEVKRTRFSDYYDQQMQLFAGPSIDREIAGASMSAYFRMLRNNPQVLRMMWWMLLEKDDKVASTAEELREVAIDRIRAAQQAGVVRQDIAPSFILMAFLGLVHAWFMERDFVKADDSQADAYLESAWRILIEGIMVGSVG